MIPQSAGYTDMNRQWQGFRMTGSLHLASEVSATHCDGETAG